MTEYFANNEREMQSLKGCGADLLCGASCLLCGDVLEYLGVSHGDPGEENPIALETRCVNGHVTQF